MRKKLEFTLDPEARPQVTASVREDPKPKPAPKSEPEPEPKWAPKPKIDPAPKAEPAPAPKWDPKPKLQSAPEPEPEPVPEPDLEPFEDTIPRVHDYVYIYGPKDVVLPGVVRQVREGDPPRCLLQGFAANGLTQLANIPVGKAAGDEWHCELVARFEPLVVEDEEE